MPDNPMFPLTSPQLSIWYTEKTYPGTSISNVAGTLMIKGPVDFELLNQSINLFIEKNEGIRLRIHRDGSGEPVQYITPFQFKDIELIDFSQCSDPMKALYEWDSREILKPFDLLDQDLYRFYRIKLGEAEGGVLGNIHHIISDAWSMGLMGSTVMDYYSRLINGRSIEEVSAPSYLTAVENEGAYKNSDRFEKDRIFWEHQFDTPLELTALKPRKTQITSTQSSRKTFIAPRKFTQKLRDYCEKNKLSPFPLFLAALAMYLGRVTGKESVVIGTPILNRLNSTDKKTLGMFISTIPLNIPLNQEGSFASFSQDIVNLFSSAYRHQRYPYERILKHAREKHGITENLYDIVLSYQNTKLAKNESLDYSTRWHFNGHQANSLTIHINDRDDEGLLILDYDYHTDRYYGKEIDFIHRHVLSLLWHGLDSPQKNLMDLEMLSENEKIKILLDFNHTEEAVPQGKPIHQLFEEQAQKTPNHIALIFEDQKITYQELNERSNFLARMLREKGVTRESIVAICVHRSIEMMVGILAILKAGGAYLPLEPNYPDNRIQQILESSKALMILSDDSTHSRVCHGTAMNIHSFKNQRVTNLNGVNQPGDLAYVIYTSGTTGEPKGVMIEHTSVVNFIYAVSKIMNFSEGVRVLSSTTLCFDIFVFEVFTSLLKGATLVLANEAEQKVPRLTCELIEKQGVNIMLTTPSKMRLLLSEKDLLHKLHSLREIMVGGEAFPPDLLKKIRAFLPLTKVINGYGPTETTVGVAFKELGEDGRITVGKPITNTQFYILDKNQNPVPIGISGELYIGGACLARGYLNRRDLTKEKFIDNPFTQGELLYQTGDIARWYPEGEVEIIGRVDRQVKINGYRIELEEIQKQLLNIAGIKDATVIDRMIDNRRVLCAYLASDKKMSAKHIRRELAKYLPTYMIPLYYIRVEGIPMNNNGKINYSQLPEPQREVRPASLKKPVNQIEKDLIILWQSVLNREIPSINDSLYEMGGDSLSIITITSRIYTQYGIEIPMNDFYKVDTISKMSKYILKHQSEQRGTMRREELVLIKKAPSQQHLFLIHAGNGEIGAYQELGSQMELNCWAIRATCIDLAPKNLTIRQLALQYLSAIKEVQPKGPYHIGGWCIGGTIAYELAKVFEDNGDKVNFLGMFNTIAPKDWEDIHTFSLENELRFVTASLGKILGNPDALSTVKELWERIGKMPLDLDGIISTLPFDIRVILPKIEKVSDFIHYINTIRSLHYARANFRPSHRIDAQIHFFSAVNDRIIFDKALNLETWADLSRGGIVTYPIEADHYSIMKAPPVYKSAEIINRILCIEAMEHYG